MSDIRTDKVRSERWLLLPMIVVVVTFLLFFSPSTSSLFSFEGWDSAVFKSMGQAILEGKILYRDIFDTKGPILYLINALGLAIAGRAGIFLLQCIGMSVALWFMYRMARLFSSVLWSVGSLLLALFVYTVFIAEGNQCEEWMMYGFAPALFVAMRWYRDLTTNPSLALCSKRMIQDGLVYGLVFSYAFFIRPNDAVGFIGGLCLVVALLIILHKQINSLLPLGMGVVIGIIVVSAPIIAWFAWHEALLYLWYGMFGVNIGYTLGIALFLSLPVVKMPLLLCLAAVSIVAWCRGGWQMLAIVGIPLGLMFLFIGHIMALHYFIVYVPFIVLGASMAQLVSRPVGLLALLVLMFVQPLNRYKQSDGPIVRLARKTCTSMDHPCLLFSRKENERLLPEGERLVSVIPSDERERVWNDLSSNYLLFSIFPHNNIVQCNRAIFNFGDNPIYIEHIRQTLSSADELPLWVVSSREQHDPLLLETNSPYCNVLETEHYTLYRLKD